MSGAAPTAAVIAALDEELGPLRRKLRHPTRSRIGGMACWSGRIGKAEVVLASGGAGLRRAAISAGRLLESVRPRALLGIGVAGALSPELDVGEVVAAAEVRSTNGAIAFSDRAWSARAAAAGAARVDCVLLSAERILASGAARARAYEAIGTRAPAAVDLESAAWLAAASACSVPALVLRAISERADEDLPDFLERCASPEGISRTRIVLNALARPGALPALYRMRQRVALCAGRLAELVERLLS